MPVIPPRLPGMPLPPLPVPRSDDPLNMPDPEEAVPRPAAGPVLFPLLRPALVLTPDPDPTPALDVRVVAAAPALAVPVLVGKPLPLPPVPVELLAICPLPPRPITLPPLLTLPRRPPPALAGAYFMGIRDEDVFPASVDSLALGNDTLCGSVRTTNEIDRGFLGLLREGFEGVFAYATGGTGDESSLSFHNNIYVVSNSLCL